ncbi:unnamed protein product [Gongylonema pulchrum]|uniref:Uncharacterized protein n=1 Tax=Gongylonema pulchrum TaxID=637853 RepID=A0A183E5N9_9BILA|nr:unnamed protein product [Gongylonema pulchrum]
MYHKTAMNQANETVQAQLLEQFAQQIWKLEGPGEVRYRLRCTLDYDTIVRLWPDHIRYLNDDWMHEGGNAEKSKNDDAVGRTPPPGTDNVSQRMKKPEQLPACEKSTEREREKFSREKERESGRSREKEKEKTRSREKERITDREKKERESSKTDLTSGSRRAGDIEKSIR